MNKLIVIVGPSGVGKTTLAQALCAKRDFSMAYEQHSERPFQSLFKQDPHYALANQLDYLIFRAEQERELRRVEKPALMDGGLDLDFQGFTRLFRKHGLLSDAEFDLCERFYNHTRALLPPPDFIIALSASEEIVGARLAARNRINIASAKDAQDLDQLIKEWLAAVPKNKILELDVSREKKEYAKSVDLILERV
jgi:deoxyadenosine/deoxycytidine kinase